MWVFMEFMNRSLDKLIELVYKKLQSTIPDQALLRIAYSVRCTVLVSVRSAGISAQCSDVCVYCPALCV